jgi:streptogramin lyase
MTQTRRLGATLFAIAIAVPSSAVIGQGRPVPVNDKPNPYETVEGWAKMPEGRTWGSTSAVAIARDGKSIWVAERCGANSCAASDLDPVLLFDETGKLVRSFGKGMIVFPHGIDVDSDGNVWVVDCSCIGARPAGDVPKGHQVYKFSPEGKLLMTLGKAGGGKGSEHFWQPNDLLVAPNGDLYVAEGHSSSDTANARVLKFDKNGKLLATWGDKKGTGPLQFDQPHALAMDSRGRLFIGDRGNNRIQIVDQNGKLLDTWYQFSRPSGIYIDKNDVIYVADSESGSVTARQPDPRKDWLRGIRIGSAKDGTVTAFIPDPLPAATGTSAAEGVAVDSRGIIYGAEVGPRALKRYVRKP